MSKNSKVLTHSDGRSMSVISWAIELEVSARCIHDRISRGVDWWVPRKNFRNTAITQPISGETLTGQEWADRLFIEPPSLRQRILRYTKDPENASDWWDEGITPGPQPRKPRPNPDQLELFEDLHIHESHDLTDWQKVKPLDIGGRVRNCQNCGYEVIHRISEPIKIDEELKKPCEGF